MFVPNLEDADLLVLSFCGVRELGAAAALSQRYRGLVLSKENDGLLWSAAASEFIEWSPDSTPDVACVHVAYGGYRRLLQFRLDSGLKQGWDHLQNLEKERIAKWFHPLLVDPDCTMFFMDYFLELSQQEDVVHQYLMTQAHHGLIHSGWYGSYRDDAYGTTRLEEDGDYGSISIAQKSGPYARRCRPAALSEQGRIVVQISAIDLSRRGQYCREMLVEEFAFEPRRVMHTDTLTREAGGERFTERDSGVFDEDDEDDSVYNFFPSFLTWDDNCVATSEESWPPSIAYSSAAWKVHARALPYFFRNGESFLRSEEDWQIYQTKIGARTHDIIRGRHAAGEPVPSDPVLAAHLDGPFDLARMRAISNMYDQPSS